MSSGEATFVIFGFAGTHEALQAENLLLSAGVDVALIPTPKVLGSLCGFALRVPSGARSAALEALAGAHMQPAGEAEVIDRVVGHS